MPSAACFTGGRLSLSSLSMRVAVVGAGAWGTALALAAVRRGAEGMLWSFDPAHVAEMRRERANPRFFPGFSLPESLGVTDSLAEVASFADAFVVAVPSHVARATLEKLAPYVEPRHWFVSATKGIEEGTGLLMTGVVGAVLGEGAERASVALSGPSFAKEVASGAPTNLVAASKTVDHALAVQKAFSNETLRVYTSDDPIGVEVGGALKNVIAIAAGACDGFGLGDNARAALITRGIAEMSRVAVALGGNARTLAGLSGIGDLVLTCTGALSRNRTLGRKLGEGVPLREALDSSQGIAEGYTTAKSAYDLARKLRVEVPILEAVHSVLYEGVAPQTAVSRLLSRPLHGEWDVESPRFQAD